MVEEKAIYSIEKFLVARRLMYWQVYLHKTVLSAEMILVKILERAREIGVRDQTVLGTGILTDFLLGRYTGKIVEHLEDYCSLDDTDIVAAIKQWCHHPDKVLSYLCMAVMNRRLMKVSIRSGEIPAEELIEQEKPLWKN